MKKRRTFAVSFLLTHPNLQTSLISSPLDEHRDESPVVEVLVS